MLPKVLLLCLLTQVVGFSQNRPPRSGPPQKGALGSRPDATLERAYGQVLTQNERDEAERQRQVGVKRNRLRKEVGEVLKVLERLQSQASENKIQYLEATDQMERCKARVDDICKLLRELSDAEAYRFSFDPNLEPEKSEIRAEVPVEGLTVISRRGTWKIEVKKANENGEYKYLSLRLLGSPNYNLVLEIPKQAVASHSGQADWILDILKDGLDNDKLQDGVQLTLF